ncbi:MAG: hypothetical protein S4CHLAM7_10700 [Chlamydiae bacterium]|nr:hypothetical protein [Chlamydiota bacterium]
MNKDEVEIFVKRLIKIVWENQEVDCLDRFYSENLEGYYNDEKVTFKELANKIFLFHKHMKKLKIELLHLAVEKDKYVIYANQRFESLEGKKMSIPSIMFAHIKDKKIHKYWLKTRIPLNFN